MKIKKEYTYSNNRQIWRLLTTLSGKLIIEERDTQAKEAFFNCIEIETGRKIFSDYQLEEKFWIGIEAIHDDIIYFNKYLKPDMPQHNGIIAFDITAGKILWEIPDVTFLYIKEGSVYAYKQKFEGRSFFSINSKTGAVLKELHPGDITPEGDENPEFRHYMFPEPYYPGGKINSSASELLEDYRSSHVVIGTVEFLQYDSLLLLDAFEPNNDGTLSNIFKAIEIHSGKVIFEEILNKNARAAVPDTFFVRKNFLFMLSEKTKLFVCSIN